MASTEEMRQAWSPACDVQGNETISFGDAGAKITVDALTIPIWRAVEAIFAEHHYTIRKADTGAYNCRKITGGSGYSLHSYGIAVDVNWSTNPYGSSLRTDMPPDAIRAIEALSVDGMPVIRWGGRYSGNKDAMHFEVIVPPSVAVKFHYEQPTIPDFRQEEDMQIIRWKKGPAPSPPLVVSGALVLTCPAAQVERYRKAGVPVVELDGDGAKEHYGQFYARKG